MRLLPIVCVLLVALVAARISTSSNRLESVPYRIGVLPAALTPNERISYQMQKLFQGEIQAPEHFAFSKDGGIYFGVADGRIMRTLQDPGTGALAPLETVVYTGEPLLVDRNSPCGTDDSEPICGRPLGMAFASDKLLIVADAHLGLLEVDVVARTKRVLLREVDGQSLYFPNSVVIGPRTGLVYFTDSSTRWRRRDFIYEVLESQPTGRLISYNRSSGKSRVLVKNIAFANGLLVDPVREQYIILNELNRARLLRVDLQQAAFALPTIDAITALQAQEDVAVTPANPTSPPKILSVLISNLPGIPDNLSWEEDDQSGRFWVGAGTARQQPFSLGDALAPWPSVRTFLAALLPKTFFLKTVPRVGLLMQLQLDGPNARSASIVDTLQDNTGATTLLTGAYQHRGYLYIGAISHEYNYVGRIPWGVRRPTPTAMSKAAQPPTEPPVQLPHEMARTSPPEDDAAQQPVHLR
jgi:sugar lactone lactonase YvrE